MQDALPPRLAEIVEEFRFAEGREKLELLLEYSEQLPVLPEWLQQQRDALEQVHECMTPVFVYAQANAGRLQFFIDVPPEAPTVRGYAEILRSGLENSTPEQILSVPADFIREMGLPSVLSAQRLNGVTALLAYLKRLAARGIQAPEQARAD